MSSVLPAAVVAHSHLLASSFRRLTGRALVSVDAQDPQALARALWEAPFALVSHGTEADPVFNYGNRTALRLFEMSWEDFVALPSRRSAEPVHRDERARLLAAVSAKGFIDDYSGIRIAKRGRRFRIRDAVVWNVTDEDGALRGQAATFASWEDL